MTAPKQLFRLASQPGEFGLVCGSDGLSLAGVALLRKTSQGFRPRSAEEITSLLGAAYGSEGEPLGLSSGLAVVAQALNKGDLGRAMIAAVLLRLPDPGPEGAARIAGVSDKLEKYSPDQPRDEQGRWTSEGAANSGGSAAPKDEGWRQNHSAGQALISKPSGDSAKPVYPDHPYNPPAHLYGGSLIPIQNFTIPGIGHNLPAEDASEQEGRGEPLGVTQVDPLPDDAEKVPDGWDKPGQYIDGLYYPPTRTPILPDGTPWPAASHDLIRSLLSDAAVKDPRITLYVPIDRRGPVLLGESATLEYARPGGYEDVTIIGRPQSVKNADGVETGHAQDSIDEALRLVETNEFSEIFFNRSFSTATNRIVESLRRPDVFAVVRSRIDTPFRYRPYESLSPGQNLKDRQEQMPDVPGIAPVRGQHYKRLYRLSDAYCERLGVRYLCS